MKNTSVSIHHLMDYYRTWHSDLRFCEGEFDFFDKKLSEVVVLHPPQEVLAQAEHFQNALYIHRNRLIEARQLCDALERDLKHAALHSSHVRADDLTRHQQLEAQMQTLRRIYTNFKHEFRAYLEQNIAALQ